MDVLGDALTAIRTGSAHSSISRMNHRFGVRFPPSSSAGFHVVLQGACWLLPPTGDPIQLGPGDVVLVPKGLGHALAATPTQPLVDFDSSAGEASENSSEPIAAVTLCGAYYLDIRRQHPLLAQLPEVLHLPARVGHHPMLRSAVDLLGEEIERKAPGNEIAVPALLDVLLLYLLRAWMAEQATPTGWLVALSDPVVGPALRAIHQHPARAWSVETLAAEGRASRAAFARRFVALTGQPPLTYVTWWRMTLAARLLEETDASIATIAERVGYRSEFAFAKAFKRDCQLSPGRYRRRKESGVLAGSVA